VAWLASEAESALRQDVSAASADACAASRIGQFAEMWREESKRTGPLWDNFYRLGQTSQEVAAAGFEFWGRKPHRWAGARGPYRETCPLGYDRIGGLRCFVPSARRRDRAAASIRRQKRRREHNAELRDAYHEEREFVKWMLEGE
jgi:hypothetical protein